MVNYRSRFLARLVHELRTPLTSILGFAEILISQEQLTETQTCFCEKIQNSALQLQANLTQLADLSRLEVGQTEVFLEEFSLAEVLRESCAAVARQAQKHSVVVKFDPESDLPTIVSDRSKLRHVLYNFLAYAISRSPEGASVNATANSRDQEFLVIIEDEGEPLSDPSQALAGGEFPPTSQLAGGSEIGLAIARHLINVLGAKLTFQNRQPRGLLVTIQLAARPARPNYLPNPER
jgi:signal transduction histidine kinase